MAYHYKEMWKIYHDTVQRTLKTKADNDMRESEIEYLSPLWENEFAEELEEYLLSHDVNEMFDRFEEMADELKDRYSALLYRLTHRKDGSILGGLIIDFWYHTDPIFSEKTYFGNLEQIYHWKTLAHAMIEDIKHSDQNIDVIKYRFNILANQDWENLENRYNTEVDFLQELAAQQ